MKEDLRTQFLRAQEDVQAARNNFLRAVANLGKIWQKCLAARLKKCAKGNLYNLQVDITHLRHIFREGNPARYE